MKKLMWLVVVLAVLSIGALAGMSLTAEPPSTFGKTSDGRLPPCPESPNCVCSYDTDADHAIEPFAMTGEVSSELKRLADFISEHQRTRLVVLEDDYLRAEYTSKLFRYVDDVEFLADPDGKTLHVRSASRAGHSDLGMNRQRIEILRIQFHSGQGDEPEDVDEEQDDQSNDETVAASATKSDSGTMKAVVGFGAVDDSELVVVRSRKSTKDLPGREGAAKDIAAGILILREQPLPNPPWWNAYSKLLREECGVTIEVIKHDTARFSDDDLEYNTVMKTEIERKFGTGILGKLKKRAQEK